MLGKSRNDMTKAKCFNCREPAHDITYFAKTIKPSNDKRHWLLHDVGDEKLHERDLWTEERYQEGNEVI